MKKTSETVVFFGSGPVAAKSLELLAKHTAIEAVITKPKPVHHRGDFPVVATAERLNLNIHTPANRKELDELLHTITLHSEVGVVIDYGIIISQAVIDYFPLGIVNSHFSLLPEWRGADPISFAILSGQKQTGVSLMLITAGLDEGPLLAQAPYQLPPDITTPELANDLIDLSDEMLQEILPLYIDGKIDPAPQEQVSIAKNTTSSYSRKLSKEDGAIDWTKPARQIEREIRAFIDWPKSRTTLAGKDIVVTKASVVRDQSGKPGAVEVRGKELIVHCGQNALRIERLKPAGKKEMTAEGFLAGHRNLV